MRVAGKTHCQPHSRPAFGYLRSERAGQLDPAGAVAEVGLVLLARAVEVRGQRGLDRGRQHRHPILVALAVADDDLVRREVDVLHAQATAFQQAQPRAVQQERHEPWHAVEPLEDGADLVPRQHDGQMQGPLGADDVVEPRKLDAEHLAVEKEQGAQGLVLGGGRDLVVNGERGQEGGDLGCAHLGRVALAVEEDVPPDPVDVRLLGAAAVVAGADRPRARGRGAEASGRRPPRLHGRPALPRQRPSDRTG